MENLPDGYREIRKQGRMNVQDYPEIYIQIQHELHTHHDAFVKHMNELQEKGEGFEEVMTALCTYSGIFGDGTLDPSDMDALAKKIFSQLVSLREANKIPLIWPPM